MYTFSLYHCDISGSPNILSPMIRYNMSKMDNPTFFETNTKKNMSQLKDVNIWDNFMSPNTNAKIIIKRIQKRQEIKNVVLGTNYPTNEFVVYYAAFL